MFNYLADLAQSFTAHRVLLPAWLGCALHKAQAARLHKGASHKYIRKVPTGKTGKTGKPTFRYFYTVGGGAGLGHHDEFKVGAAFAVKDAGKAGHFHIVKMPSSGAEGITIRHDESGKTATITRAALRELLHNEHAEPLRQAKERAAATLEQAKKTGSPKQQERAAALVSKYGGLAMQDLRNAEWLAQVTDHNPIYAPGVKVSHYRDNYYKRDTISIRNPNDTSITINIGDDNKVSVVASYRKYGAYNKTDENLSEQTGATSIQALLEGKWYDPAAGEIVTPRPRAINAINATRLNDNQIDSDAITIEGNGTKNGKAWLARINAGDPRYGLDRTFLTISNPTGMSSVKVHQLTPGFYEYNGSTHRGFIKINTNKTVELVSRQQVEDGVKASAARGVQAKNDDDDDYALGVGSPDGDGDF